MRWSRSLRCVLVFALAAPATQAEGPPQQQRVNEAREHAMRGAELFRDQDNRGALVEYRRAYEIAPNFRVQYNIGLCCFELQDWACALSAFEKYLKDGGSDVPPDRTQSVTADINQLQRRVAKLRIVVDEPGADIAVDDVVIGKSPLADPVVVTIGQRRVTATLVPNPPVTKVLEVVGGDDVEVKFVVHVAPGPIERTTRATSPSDGAATREAPPKAPGKSKVPFIVAASVTGALAAGGVVTGALALAAKSNLHSTVSRFGISVDDVTAARNKTTTFGTATDVLFASAIVGAGVTTYFFFTTMTPRAPAEVPPTGVSFGVGPGSVRLSGRF